MDKSVIFSVAGSGKTSLIIEGLSLDQLALIITYTENNHLHLRNRIIQKFGMIPTNITLTTYFSFLHGFCYRPLMQLKLGTRGINFRRPPNRQFRLDDLNRYRDGGGRLYHCRLAKLLQVMGAIPDVRARLERFYDYLYVDEVQDFAGHDFNLLLEVSQANIGVTFVGDFHQHTFDTSRDGTINNNLHDDVVRYEKRFRDVGITVDKGTLSCSWRCTKMVCDFISAKLQIPMGAHEQRVSRIITVDDQEQANLLHADPTIVKLFLSEHYKYGCYSENWGASKGMDHFNDVCVVMGPGIWKDYLAERLHQANPQTRNKLYVACTRARGDLYFMPEKLLKAFKQRK